MIIEVWLAVGLVFVLTMLIPYVLSNSLPKLRWDVAYPYLRKFKKWTPVSEEDRDSLEMYASLGVVEYGPPDGEGRLMARVITDRRL